MGVEFKRKKEVRALLEARGNGKIKVIEGLRQVGKSYLLKTLFHRELLRLGVKESQIAVLDFLIDDEEIRDAPSLKAKVRELLKGGEVAYLFMDEVQLVEGYGEALKTLRCQNPGVDIYVTGSNSKTLSKDIEREIGAEESCEILLRPLSYKEIKEDWPSFSFEDYFSLGGIPKVLLAESEAKRTEIFTSLYRDTYVKDILSKSKDLLNIGENEKRMILQRVFDTTSTGVSLKSIVKEINADNRAESKSSTAIHADVDTFFERLSDSFLFERMGEDSSKAKQGRKGHIERRGKCYCEDPGLLRFASHSYDRDSDVLENIVFSHLLSKGLSPVSLKFDYFDPLIREECMNREIDFYFEKDGEGYLVQVVLALYGGNAYQREVHNLLFAKKDGRKMLVYLSDNSGDHPDADSIEFVPVEEFLLKF